MLNVRRLLYLMLLLTTTYAARADAQIVPPPVWGRPVENAINMIYDPHNGDFTVATNGVNSAGDPLLITTFELKSASGAFNIGALCPTFGSGDPFAVKTPEKLFTLNTAGLSEICLGTVLGPGLSGEQLFADLSLTGSLKPGGSLSDAPGGGPYLHADIPEPSGLLLAVVGLLGLVGLRR